MHQIPKTSGTFRSTSVTIRDIPNNMTTTYDVESILTISDTFQAAQEISFTSSIEDITRAVLECGESGVPCVITGFPLVQDDEQSPFRQPAGWMESIYTNRSRPVPQMS